MAPWTLTYESRPWTLNAERKWHHMKRAQLVKEWRDVFAEMARFEHRIPHLDAIRLDVQARLTGPQQDPVALFPSYKAALDGLVDAGVIDDDTWDFVKGVNFLPPIKAKPHALILTVYEA